MKYIATVNGKTYEVEIERVTGAGRRPPRAEAAPAPAPQAAPPAPAAPPRPEAVRPAPPPAGGGDVLSPMPGSVLQVLVREGESVAAGQTVVLLEAMKMEIEIKAERAGTVSAVCVKKGDSVDSGAALVRL